jgi:hypothetical protein
MIALVVAAWNFVLGHKGLIPWLLLAVAVAWGGFEKVGWDECTAAAARKIADEQAQVLKQKASDKQLGDQIAMQEDDANARTKAAGATIVETIRYVTVTRDCANSPAMRAADDGLQHGLGFSRQTRPAAPGNAPQAAATETRPRRRHGPRDRRGAHPVRRGLSRTGEDVRRAGLLRRGVQTAGAGEVTRAG